MDGWGRIKDIARYMSISDRSVRTLLKQGLPHARLNHKTIIIKYSDVDAYLENYKVEENKIDRIVDEMIKRIK